MPTLSPLRMSLTIDGGGASEWYVRRLEMTEGLSEPYAATIDVATPSPDLTPPALLGRSVALAFNRDGAPVRKVAGVLSRVELGGSLRDLALARLHVVPAFKLLDHQITTRMFQGKTVPEILRAVLEPGLALYGRTLELDLTETYPKREYCLQYAESDLAFAERLMQDAGIFYAFEHGDTETMVLADATTSCKGVEGATGSVVAQHEGGAFGTEEALSESAQTAELRPTQVLVHDYDWTRPNLDITERYPMDAGSSPAGGEDQRARAVHVYAGGATLGQYEGDHYTATDAKARARVRLEAEVSGAHQGEGRGSVPAFVPGRFFTAPHSALAGKQLLTRVVHVAHGDDPVTGQEPGPERPAYVNSFVCVEATRPYRSRRSLPRPSIPGLQNAVVAGPEGEEIFTDIHGRVKVRFFWDATGESSCWLRVLQSWAGAGWGATYVPRICHEVLVAFIDGDPDRPVVVGSAYNGVNPTPFPLPEQKTRAGLKTSSSPTDGGYSELSFEDRAGGEQLRMQAQRDLEILVKKDKNQRVLGQETLAVTLDRSRRVEGDHTLFVGGEDQSTVRGRQAIEVLQDREIDVKGHHRESVALTHTTAVGINASLTVGAALEITVGGLMAETIGGEKVETIAGNKNETVLMNRQQSVLGRLTEETKLTKSETVGETYTLHVDERFETEVGGSMVTEVSKDMAFSAKGHAHLSAKKDLNVSGKRVSIVADDELSFTVGQASITLKKSGSIVLAGVAITVDADGSFKVKSPAMTKS